MCTAFGAVRPMKRLSSNNVSASPMGIIASKLGDKKAPTDVTKPKVKKSITPAKKSNGYGVGLNIK